MEPIPKGKGVSRVWLDSEHLCVFRAVPATYLAILFEASKIKYLPVSHVRPLVYVNLKFAGHAEACQLHSEQVVGMVESTAQTKVLLVAYIVYNMHM